MGVGHLRVELHALNRELTVAQPHDEAVGLRRHHQLVGHGGAVDDERVVSSGSERFGKAREDSGAVVVDL